LKGSAAFRNVHHPGLLGTGVSAPSHVARERRPERWCVCIRTGLVRNVTIEIDLRQSQSVRNNTVEILLLITSLKLRLKMILLKMKALVMQYPVYLAPHPPLAVQYGAMRYWQRSTGRWGRVKAARTSLRTAMLLFSPGCVNILSTRTTVAGAAEPLLTTQ